MPNNLNKAIIVGVDYGYGNVKTVNNIFASTLKELPVKPSLPRKTIEFEGKYYAIGSGKIGIQKSKTDDSTMLILTAAAIASELSMKGIREGNIILAVGTVLTRLGAEKKDFIEYYKRHRELEFRYEDDFFRLHIQSVEVFPQGYAAIVPHSK